ncbi:unnamed protein product [Rotaria sp. Silwood1]|nr:unnamed protein product [Rotaria sp. Silwood1]
MPKKKDSTLNTPQSLDYNDIDDEDNDNEEDLSDEEYESERLNSIKENLPRLTQILIVARLIGKREFVLSRNGTKKFYNKIHQYQELSQREKSDDVNYGSRLGKSAEILCKLAGISEIVKIALEILKILQDQNQLKYDDTSFSFIRNATQVIENKYSSQTMVLEIQSSSCHLTGYLFCSHLIKMLFAIYNIEPVLLNDKKTAIETISLHSTTNKIRECILQIPHLFFLKRDLTGSIGLLRHFSTDMVNTIIDEFIKYQLLRQGPFITTTSRAIVHMKSYPSNDILNDPIKRSVVDRIFNDAEMDLQSYMITLSNSIIKQKQVLTMNGKQVLMLPEHQLLYENLKRKYPERNLDDIHASNNIDNVTIANNLRLHSETTSSQSTDNQPRSNQDIAVKVISGKVLSHQNDEQTYTPLNQLLQQLHTNSRIEQSHNMSSSNNNIYISPTDVLLGILEFYNTMSDNNLTTTKQINNSIPNIEEKFSISPTTNILLSTFVMPDHQKQVALNIHDEHNCTPCIENYTDETTTSSMISNTLETSNSLINDTNSYNLNDMDNSELTSSNIAHGVNIHSRQIQQNKRNSCCNEYVKPPRTYKKKK